MEGKGSKFNYDSYAFKNDQSKPFNETLNQRNCKRTCVCSNYNENKCFECFKCKQKTHNCTKVQINRPQIHSFECMSCLARSMDLIYQPQTILLETFFRTENIFEKSNCINFEFTLKYEQTNFPVDVRCFKGSKIELVWPMQGQFFLNGSKSAILTLRPLKSNSNRKNRKQNNFMIDPAKLKQGLNTLTFKIPRLQKSKFVDGLQYEQTGSYYLGLYSVKELTNQQVLNITQRERCHQKASTLALFQQSDDQVLAQKQKIRLIDPYTCERIKFPVRGRYCKHLSTVCLLTYISFQKHSRSWKCPICTIEAGSFLNEPYLDAWMYEILKQKDKGDNVIIYPNGMYEWQDMGKQVVGLDDSDDSQSEPKIIQNMQLEKIIQQQPLVLAMQNIQLQSQPQQQQQSISQQPQQVDLCQYEYIIDFNQSNPLHESPMQKQSVSSGQMVDAEIWETQRHDVDSGQIYDGLQDISKDKREVNSINIMENEDRYHQFNQQYPVISDVLIDDEEHPQLQDSRISQSNSEFQHFAQENQFVPHSIISNIVITNKIQAQKKQQAKLPEIYSKPLQKKSKIPHKQSLFVGQNVISQKLLSQKSKVNTSHQSINNLQTNKALTSNKNLLQNPQKPKNQPPPRYDKFIENKRLLQRPNFIESIQNIKAQKSLSVANQKYQNLSLGKVNKKNIEISQSKSLKNQPKTQYYTINQKFIFPPPKKLKNQENQQEKPKQIKIKTMKFDQISHSKFVKHYCKIPIPALLRKMNDDMKRLFRNILEIN